MKPQARAELIQRARNAARKNEAPQRQISGLGRSIIDKTQRSGVRKVRRTDGVRFTVNEEKATSPVGRVISDLPTRQQYDPSSPYDKFLVQNGLQFVDRESRIMRPVDDSDTDEDTTQTASPEYTELVSLLEPVSEFVTGPRKTIIMAPPPTKEQAAAAQQLQRYREALDKAIRLQTLQRAIQEDGSQPIQNSQLAGSSRQRPLDQDPAFMMRGSNFQGAGRPQIDLQQPALASGPVSGIYNQSNTQAYGNSNPGRIPNMAGAVGQINYSPAPMTTMPHNPMQPLPTPYFQYTQAPQFTPQQTPTATTLLREYPIDRANGPVAYAIRFLLWNPHLDLGYYCTEAHLKHALRRATAMNFI
ncbi:hypothetical protein BDV95DRAFT_619540 [Massariosphaeria phaeospora]|uniref:Uncharacterized protein n=1 Tax=Massariosphaeria phaeospora TaxID=100035 RepID=A0A7C8M6W0_9PLEO|nr:hypothetical protein BDV95DRAFT_619540 [Massariosphaeria phaeospora]